MIFYTNLLIPKRFAAYTYFGIILIRPDYRDDLGLKMHELTHIAQFKCDWLQPLKYWLSDSHRLGYEVEAFKVQLKYSPGNELKYARLISENYDLDITILQALELLK